MGQVDNERMWIFLLKNSKDPDLVENIALGLMEQGYDLKGCEVSSVDSNEEKTPQTFEDIMKTGYVDMSRPLKLTAKKEESQKPPTHSEVTEKSNQELTELELHFGQFVLGDAWGKREIDDNEKQFVKLCIRDVILPAARKQIASEIDVEQMTMKYWSENGSTSQTGSYRAGVEDVVKKIKEG